MQTVWPELEAVASPARERRRLDPSVFARRVVDSAPSPAVHPSAFRVQGRPLLLDVRTAFLQHADFTRYS